VRTKFLREKQAVQFQLKYNGKGLLFRLQRVQAGYCNICSRVHESDNAFLKLRTSGLLSFHCYRSMDEEPRLMGLLDFIPTIECLLFPVSPPAILFKVTWLQLINTRVQLLLSSPDRRAQVRHQQDIGSILRSWF